MEQNTQQSNKQPRRGKNNYNVPAEDTPRSVMEQNTQQSNKQPQRGKNNDNVSAEDIPRSDPKIIEIQALGKPLHPGTLYDWANGKMFPGVFLWDEDDISKAVLKRPQPSTSIDFASSDSFSEKSKLMNISVSVKTSFLAGLVEVGGSAGYLTDTRSSRRQCRATFKYRQMTEHKELDLTKLGNVKHTEVFDNNPVTHVVIAVEYGVEAYMVFDQLASKEEDKHEIQASMETSVTAFPGISVSAKGEVQMSEEQKKEVEKLGCTFYGDFALDKNPATYIDALQVYQKLPTLVGDGSKAVPIKVSLYPLSKLHPGAAKVFQAISTNLMADLEVLIDQLTEAEMRINDEERRSKEIKATDIIDKMVKFKKNLKDYTEILKQNICKVLPAIRGGKVREEKMVDILKFHKESSFTHDKVKKWLDDKETEIGMVHKYITSKSLKDCEVLPPGPELCEAVGDPDQTDVAVFAFTSLKDEEPYLSNLDACLADEEFKKMQEISVAQKLSFKEEALPWFKKPVVLERIREVKEHLSKLKFPKKPFISYISNKEYPGASIYVYHLGLLDQENWKPK